VVALLVLANLANLGFTYISANAAEPNSFLYLLDTPGQMLNLLIRSLQKVTDDTLSASPTYAGKFNQMLNKFFYRFWINLHFY
jgi:hypothetical protein